MRNDFELMSSSVDERGHATSRREGSYRSKRARKRTAVNSHRGANADAAAGREYRSGKMSNACMRHEEATQAYHSKRTNDILSCTSCSAHLASFDLNCHYRRRRKWQPAFFTSLPRSRGCAISPGDNCANPLRVILLIRAWEIAEDEGDVATRTYTLVSYRNRYAMQ